MGRKRKIPDGYIPRWKSDSEDSNSEIDLTPSEPIHLSTASNVSACPSLKVIQECSPIPKKPTVTNITIEPPLHHQPEVVPEPPVLPSGLDVGDIEFETEDESHDNLGIILDDSIDTVDDVLDNDIVVDYDTDLYVDGEDMGAFLNFEFNDDYLPDEGDAEEEYGRLEEEDEEEEEEDQDSYEYIFRRFAEEWSQNSISHRASKQATVAFWNVSRKWMFKLTSSFVNDKIKKFPKYEHTHRKVVQQNVPRISMDVGYIKKENNELTILSDVEKLPIQKFPRDAYEKAFEIASIKVRIHRTFLPNSYF